MNITRGASLALALTFVSAARTTAEDASAPEWSWRPALYALGTLDDTTGSGSSSFNGELGEPSAGLGLGASLDGERQWSRGSFETNLMALARSPYDTGGRSLSLVGRVHATHELGAGLRLGLTDFAKVQRRANGFATDFQRNEVRVDLRWPVGRSWDVGVQGADRRRSVEDLPELGFDFQTASLVGSVRAARQVTLRFEGGLQRYHAPTAEGQRWQVVFEAVRVHRTGVLAVRALYVEPRGGDSGTALAPGYGGTTAGAVPPQFTTVPNAVSDAARASFLEAATTVASEASLPYDDALIDTLWLDPLQEDADEWDFGRSKRGFALFGSQRLGERVTLSARLSLIARRGPDLLQPVPTPSYHEERWELRGGAQVRLNRRLALVLQGSYLDSDGDRPALDFRRVLAAAGVQIRF